MERHEILEAMSELKLYGMRASFDEIAGKGPRPRGTLGCSGAVRTSRLRLSSRNGRLWKENRP
jgi:hypothetical protein